MRFNLDEITRALSSQLQPGRFLHSLGVVQASVVLAGLNGLDSEKAAAAALLHDSARHLSLDEQRQLASRSGMPAAELDEKFAFAWHGPAAAVLAREHFGIDDDEVLDAIAHHTVGRADPSPTLMVLMAADYCEPTRNFEGVAEARQAVRRDLQRGLLSILQNKLKHVQEQGRTPHPRANEIIEHLRRQEKRESKPQTKPGE